MTNQTERKPRVAVIYKSLSHYRKPFFEQLRERLEECGIELVLIYGEPDDTNASKNDFVEIPWAHKIENKVIHFGEKIFYWQPCLPLLKDVDLVIVEQANKVLINYYLWVLNLFGKIKLAFWGHGKNFQASSKDKFSEALKRFMANKVHWWFAYNDLSAEIVRFTGFPEKRITVVQNAIDTQFLIEGRARISSEDLDVFRSKIGIRSRNVAIYVGGIYAEKRISFLLEACRQIKSEVPDFEMIFLGAGSEGAIVRDAVQQHPWIHYEGPKFGVEKIYYFMISKLLLMPGLVGLAVLDAFALEVPLITTDIPFHSPEISYLKNGVNGEIVSPSDSVEKYTERVMYLLKNEAARQILVEGCRKAKDKYTIENMVENFSRGVCEALKN